MSSDQWQRVTEFFQAALERPAEERTSFLQDVCGENRKLYETVNALLDADKEASEFMESPLTQKTFEAIELAARKSGALGRKADPSTKN